MKEFAMKNAQRNWMKLSCWNLICFLFTEIGGEPLWLLPLRSFLASLESRFHQIQGRGRKDFCLRFLSMCSRTHSHKDIWKNPTLIVVAVITHVPGSVDVWIFNSVGPIIALIDSTAFSQSKCVLRTSGVPQVGALHGRFVNGQVPGDISYMNFYPNTI